MSYSDRSKTINGKTQRKYHDMLNFNTEPDLIRYQMHIKWCYHITMQFPELDEAINSRIYITESEDKTL